MANHRVVITGIGVIAPNGVGRIEFENSLRSGHSGIKFFEKSKTLNFKCQIAGKPNITSNYKQIYFDDYYQNKLKNDESFKKLWEQFEKNELSHVAHRWYSESGEICEEDKFF